MNSSLAAPTPAPGTRSALSGGSAQSAKLPPAQRRRIRQVQEKKIGDDEFMAAAIGDLQWLKQSQKGLRGEINYDRNGMAPLHLASIHGRLECLKYLIEVAGIDVNLPSKNGWRAVHLVISNQTGKRAFECLQYLLQKGADPSVSNDDGITPVHQAASEGHIPCLKALLETGAKVNCVDHRGHSPLDLAKLWGHRKCARILAAAEWHQDKAFLAQEVNSLHKLKVQQMKKEIALAKELYGENRATAEQSYQDWLQRHNIKESDSTENEIAKNKQFASIADSDRQIDARKRKDRSSPDIQRGVGKVKSEVSIEAKRSNNKKASRNSNLYQANSVARHDRTGDSVDARSAEILRPSAVRSEPKTQVVTKENVIKTDSSIPPHIPLTGNRTEASFGLLRTVSDTDQMLPDTQANKENQDDKVKELAFVSAVPWNPSTKVKETFWDYMPKLPDYYPRDEYTMLPKPPIKRKPQRPKSRDRAISRASSAGFSHLSEKDIVEAFDTKPSDRVTVFKCHNVTDIPKRKPGDPNILHNDETGLHLTTNIRTWLFRNGLLPHLVPLWRSMVESDAMEDEGQTFPENKKPAEPSWDCLW